MGAIYETVKRIEAAIERRRLPLYKTRGLIALRAGFLLGMVTPDTPDDPLRIAVLKAAAREVLGEEI
ncbi:MAG TPA: hypothetical protein VFF02_09100 [Anaeromyxobacteraceae bacterium]|nr:hypothetical protein [Anaeromyxobacteraceae bacterium]